jgi:IS30 family transposase
MPWTKWRNTLEVHISAFSRFESKRDSTRNWCAPNSQSVENLTMIKSELIVLKLHRWFSLKSIKKNLRDFLNLLKNILESKQDFSPEQITSSIKLDIDISVVHETIYRYIYINKKMLVDYIHISDIRIWSIIIEVMIIVGTIIDRIIIVKRPKIVEKQSHIGDW